MADEEQTDAPEETPEGAAEESPEEGEGKEKKGGKQRKHRRKPSRRHTENKALVDGMRSYELEEAVAIIKRQAKGIKFDQTVELAIRLGIDPKQSDQQVRGTVVLPKGTGKSVKVLVFAEGEKAAEAEQAGADYVGSKDLADKIANEGWLDFDIALATPDMMKHVGRLGRVLGPHGKMPSPKAGTLTMDIARSVEEFKAGKIEYRNDKQGNLCCPIGKESFSEEDIIANAQAVLDHLEAIRPTSAKGNFFRKAYLSTTMGPGIKLAVSTAT